MIDTIPPEVLDLVRFLANTYTEIDRFVYENCDGNALMKYPVVQGTSNQIKLNRIGEQSYDKTSIGKAVAWMIENAPNSRTFSEHAELCDSPT